MSATFKRKAATANTAGVIVHTTPVNTTALIIGLVLANKGNAAETADVDIDGTYIVKNAPIPIGSTLSVLDGKVVVQQNWLCEHEVIATNKKDITTRFLRDNNKKINKDSLLKERVVRITKVKTLGDL